MADQSATSRLRLLLLVGPVVLSVLLYQRDEFDPAPLPVSASWLIREVPARNDRLLTGSEKVGDGLLPGPEDLAYCAETGFLYTGCSDGWIKRVAINGSLGQVENWAFVGGRPFGLAFGPGGELVVANSEKGLMRLTGEGTAEVLAGEAEGVPFRLTDGVDVAANGIIYFTDASYKYDLKAHILDILEGRPYGRLMSFEPSINRTRVLARDLYFANGVAISPGQDFLVFCESPLRRCSRYYMEGEKKGTIDNFVDDLPGFPDNIRYDGDGHFWIGLPSPLEYRISNIYSGDDKFVESVLATYDKVCASVYSVSSREGAATKEAKTKGENTLFLLSSSGSPLFCWGSPVLVRAPPHFIREPLFSLEIPDSSRDPSLFGRLPEASSGAPCFCPGCPRFSLALLKSDPQRIYLIPTALFLHFLSNKRGYAWVLLDRSSPGFSLSLGGFSSRSLVPFLS